MARVDAPITRTVWVGVDGKPTPWFYQFIKDLWTRTGGFSDTVSINETVTSTLQLGGGREESVYQTDVSSDYTVTGSFDHEIVNCTNAVGTTITITMPNLYEGAKVTVIRSGVGNVAVTSSDGILGQTTQYLPMQYDAASMRGTTSQWVLV